jgi:hypothetical protein
LAVKNNWASSVRFWQGFAVVFLLIAAFMTAYSLGWLSPAKVVYLYGEKQLVPAPQPGGLLSGFTPKTIAVIVPKSGSDKIPGGDGSCLMFPDDCVDLTGPNGEIILNVCDVCTTVHSQDACQRAIGTCRYGTDMCTCQWFGSPGKGMTE